MIVRNESHQLADCLGPVANLFDEIVIVDTGSHDETRQVARRFTPNVLDFTWRDDFSAARNEGLRHARGDWVFWLDADDRLTSDNVAKLGNLFDGLNGQPSAYLIDTLCPDEAGSEWGRVVTHPRLFRRHPALAWHRRIHERLRPWPASLGFDMVFSDVRIDHVGYCDSAVVQRKNQRNLRLLRMEYAVNPNDSETLLDLGVAHMSRGNLAEARRYFSCLLESDAASCGQTRRLFTSLVELDMHQGRFQSAIDNSARGLVLFSSEEYLAYLQSDALYQLAEYEAARVVLTNIIQGPEPPRHICIGPNEIKRRLAPLGLGEVLRVQRHYERAADVLQSVVRTFPSDGAAWQFLGRVYIDLGQRQKLDEVLERLTACPRGSLFALLLTAAWELARGEAAAAERAIDDLITQSPKMPLARAMRAECLQRRGAPADAQLSAYRDVLRVQPGDPRATNMVRQLQEELATSQQVKARELSTATFFDGGVVTQAVGI